jgi:peptide/nickel transport system substrate-binding protein
MKRRQFLTLAGGGMAATSLAALGIACGDDDTPPPTTGTPDATGTGTAATPTAGSPTLELAASQTLRARFYFDLLPLDPATIFGIEQENVAVAVYNGLTAYNGKTELIPDLAKSWEQPDGTTWVFSLRDGVKWQKGFGDLTAQDVVDSYNRILQGGGTYAREFALVDSFTAIDPRTLQVKLKKPDGNFGHQVSNYHQGSVVNVRAIEKGGDRWGLEPVGTGPFILSNVRPGQGFELLRFDDYFAGKPTLEKIDMRTISDHNTAAIAIKNNELDLVMAIRSERALDQVANDPNIEFKIGDRWGVGLWMFNTTIPALADPRVRRAMAHAIDFEAAINATAPRLNSVAYNIVPEWMPECSADVPKYPFNLQEAKALLSAAGVSRVNVKAMQLGQPSEFFVLLQASLAQAGINLEFDIVDRAQFNQRRVSGDFEITVRGFPTANVDQILFGYLHPDNIVPKGFNSSRYNNPELTAKLEAARSELDLPKRLALYAEVQKIAMTDLPYLPYAYSNEYWAHRKTVKDVEVNRMPQGIWYPMKIAAKA